MLEAGKTYVYHVSTRRILTLSTLLTLCSQRTMRKFQYGVLSKQRRGFSKGQEVRANVEHPFVVGHLQGSVDLIGNGYGEKQLTFQLVHFV
jgi:hypothetical protein